ncbi:Hypothetical predicted protein [Mytilus galloprovincialis]|uniref:Uncharacterized protein n=1 Tax=Mytilus galloprovincialis TaxID=29158 RepID=A0A8B6GLR8_MYTGA|nr:Hypothetical predicted protein [Mytilus galloprovincialis]
MQKILLILGLVLILAVVEQTSGQICSLNYCRRRPRSNCKCRGCCLGKLGLKYGRCEPRWRFPGSRPIWSCFCYRFPPFPLPPPPQEEGSGAQSSGSRGASGSNETSTVPPV